MEQLLKTTIEAAVAMKAVKKTEFERVIVDTTVQEKAIAHPTDARLLDVARQLLVRYAKRAGLGLKQNYERECQALRRRAGGYAHAKQFKRLKTVLKRQRTILGVLIREITRKMTATSLAEGVKSKLTSLLQRAERIRTQKTKDKNKLSAMHAPEVECIGKGKARKPYEFGVKATIAVTHRSPHTKPATAVVDLGYRGMYEDVMGIEVIHRGKSKRITARQKARLRRRQAIEAVIGHDKPDHRMDHRWLRANQRMRCRQCCVLRASTSAGSPAPSRHRRPAPPSRPISVCSGRRACCRCCWKTGCRGYSERGHLGNPRCFGVAGS